MLREKHVQNREMYIMQQEVGTHLVDIDIMYDVMIEAMLKAGKQREATKLCKLLSPGQVECNIEYTMVENDFSTCAGIYR